MTPTAVAAVASASDAVAISTMWATWVQALASVGLLIAALVSIWWIRREYHQREQHELARETPHVGLRVGPVPPNAGIALNELDYGMVMRWSTNYQGSRRDPSWVLTSQRYTCLLTNLGPGTVSSAEVPYTFELYGEPPRPGLRPAETVNDVFRFYNVPAGSVHFATSAISTAYFPYFKITLHDPVVRNIRGAVVGVKPDPHASDMVAEWNNHAFWEAMRQSPHQPPLPSPPPDGS